MAQSTSERCPHITAALAEGRQIIRETYEDEFGQALWFTEGIHELLQDTPLGAELHASYRHPWLIWESLPTDDSNRGRYLLRKLREGTITKIGETG